MSPLKKGTFLILSFIRVHLWFQSFMRIVHLSTSDSGGGAFRAAFRLHTGLRRLGHEVVLVPPHKAWGWLRSRVGAKA